MLDVTKSGYLEIEEGDINYPLITFPSPCVRVTNYGAQPKFEVLQELVANTTI